jgi:hypothetical protein
MGRLVWHRCAWRIKEVSVRRPPEVRKHNGTELPVADDRGQNPADSWQVRQPRVMNRNGAGANARSPRRAGLRGAK